MSIRKEIIRSFLAQGVTSVAALSFSISLSRLVGAGGIGHFFEMMMVVMFLAVLARLGLENPLTRHLAAENTKSKNALIYEVFASIRLIGLITSLFAIFIALIYWYISGIEIDIDAIAMAISIPFVVLSSLYACALRGLGIAWPFTLLYRGIIFLVAFLIIEVIHIEYHEFRLSFAFIAFGIAAIINLIFASWLWRKASFKEGGHLISKHKYTFDFLWNSAKHTFPFTILNSAVFPWAAVFFLSKLSTSHYVGLYAVADRIASQFGIILIIIGNVTASRMSALYIKNDFSGLKKLVKKSSALSAFLGLLIILPCIFLDHKILSIFGEEFVKGTIVFDILAAGYFIHLATGNVGMLLLMTGHERETKQALLISSATLVLLMPLGIVRLKIAGAALAYSVAITIQNAVLVYFVRKRLGFYPLGSWKEQYAT